jgi:hypothetical protein
LLAPERAHTRLGALLMRQRIIGSADRKAARLGSLGVCSIELVNEPQRVADDREAQYKAYDAGHEQGSLVRVCELEERPGAEHIGQDKHDKDEYEMQPTK